MNNRLLVIGLDAAALNLIEPWVESGLLPNIARILRSGAYAPMRSSMANGVLAARAGARICTARAVSPCAMCAAVCLPRAVAWAVCIKNLTLILPAINRLGCIA